MCVCVCVHACVRVCVLHVCMRVCMCLHFLRAVGWFGHPHSTVQLCVQVLREDLSIGVSPWERKDRRGEKRRGKVVKAGSGGHDINMSCKSSPTVTSSQSVTPNDHTSLYVVVVESKRVSMAIHFASSLSSKVRSNAPTLYILMSIPLPTSTFRAQSAR